MRPETSEYLILHHPFTRFIYDATPRQEAVSPSWLARTKKLHIYAGHGIFDAFSPEESFLRFWGRKNKQRPIKQMTAAELKLHLDQSRARLVYLSGCYSTATGSQVTLLDDDFLGLADASDTP